MVQEFTGFPGPPFAPHHLGPGVLFAAGGASPSDSAAAAGAPVQLLRPSPRKLPAAPHASHLTCTTSNASSFARSLFANSNVNPTAADAAPSLSSELYSGFGPVIAGAVPRYDGGFEAAEDDRVGHGHGLFSSFLHAGERYHSH
uniref:Uncharacterized protein n=1 Tax=Arundo donax TaxID=35708 RepID=A0A0A9ASH3_ARUDO